MSPSHKLIALMLALLLGSWASAGRIDAQELPTAIVPGDPVKQTKPSAPSEQPSQVSNSAVALEKDSASSVGHHHYNSPAERAHDDMLIVEVKSALAEDGISEGYPVQVDADHGRVTLSGVVASASDVKAAEQDAAQVRGVVAVRNLLKPH